MNRKGLWILNISWFCKQRSRKGLYRIHQIDMIYRIFRAGCQKYAPAFRTRARGLIKSDKGLRTSRFSWRSVWLMQPSCTRFAWTLLAHKCTRVFIKSPAKSHKPKRRDRVIHGGGSRHHKPGCLGFYRFKRINGPFTKGNPGLFPVTGNSTLAQRGAHPVNERALSKEWQFPPYIHGLDVISRWIRRKARIPPGFFKNDEEASGAFAVERRAA